MDIGDHHHGHRFANRMEAGIRLAKLVSQSVDATDAVVLGLTRGGVPVATVVATECGIPLDIMVVSRIGLPAYPGVEVGAIGPRMLVLDYNFIRTLGLSRIGLEPIIAHQRAELERREKEYRIGLPPIPLADRTVIVVDDGIATRASMSIAISAVRNQRPRAIVVATPVAAPTVAAKLRSQVDLVLSVSTPPHFRTVSEWYDDFSPTSDDRVRDCLLQASVGSLPRSA